MASHLIGVSGRKRSGKDTFAARLVSEHGFTKVSFAEPMRAMLKAQDPIIGSHGHFGDTHLSEVLGPDDDWETAKAHPEVRRLMQALGTEAGRNILGENVWVDAAARVVDTIPGPVVITDVRFPNELAYVSTAWYSPFMEDGLTVRIDRDGLPANDPHPSETALDGYRMDVHIFNDGTIADLHDEADHIADYLGL